MPPRACLATSCLPMGFHLEVNVCEDSIAKFVKRDLGDRQAVIFVASLHAELQQSEEALACRLLGGFMVGRVSFGR